jgi:hypothetical protein
LLVLSLHFLVFLQHDPAHYSPRSTATCKELKLRKSLLRENIESVKRSPAPMGEGAHLLHEWGIERFVGQLHYYASCRAPKPLRR